MDPRRCPVPFHNYVGEYIRSMKCDDSGKLHLQQVSHFMIHIISMI